MKYRITVEVDIKTGDYDIQFNNLTDKLAGIDYYIAMEAMRRIIGDFEKRTGGTIDLKGKEIQGNN